MKASLKCGVLFVLFNIIFIVVFMVIHPILSNRYTLPSTRIDLLDVLEVICYLAGVNFILKIWLAEFFGDIK